MWFFKVLIEGSICINDEIRLQERLHPNIQTRKVASLLYKNCDLSYKIMHWHGTEKELTDILNCTELASYRFVHYIF